MRHVRDKVAVVTGGGSGIGRASALRFAAAGARIVVADIAADRAAQVAVEIETSGGMAIAVACDVAAPNGLEAMVARAVEAFGRVDILMNNAAIIFSGDVQDVTVAHWRQAFDVNLFAQVRGVQLVLPAMLERGEGHIVNVASTAALYPYNVDRMSYNASKAAVLNFSEALAMDVGPRGVGVTCLCPGPVRTNIVEQMRFVGEPRRIISPDLAVRTAEEVAEMVMHAISKDVFFLPTNPEVHAIIARRGASPDDFLAEAIANFAG